ncbi:hypothetical protein OPQ81_002051 [Rhizoctonia solani]|nr:hypothetical protein OPQ81_002051 [Rhizoctonia solani]
MEAPIKHQCFRMQPDSSLLSNPRRTGHSSGPLLTNPGASATHVVDRYTRKSFEWLLWMPLGCAASVSVLCDSVIWFYPVYRQGLIPQIKRGRRIMTAFATFFFPRLADVHSHTLSGTFARSVLVGAGNSVSMYAAGIILHTVSSRLSVLSFLFVSDYITLRWRGMALAGIYFMPLVTMWIEPRINEYFNSD